MTNENVNTPEQAKPVVAVEGTPEFLSTLATKLATDGEALVQTDEAVGSNPQPITVH